MKQIKDWAKMIKNLYEDHQREHFQYRDALRSIAALPPGCTSSADHAIEIAKKALLTGELR